MTLDVVDLQNEKVGSLEVSEEVFGGRVNTGVIWEAVVHQLACEHRGTHADEDSGSGQWLREEALAAEGDWSRARG